MLPILLASCRGDEAIAKEGDRLREDPPGVVERVQRPAPASLDSGFALYAKQIPEHFGYMVERATYSIDLPRLLAQRAALACLTAGLYVLAGRPGHDRRSDTPGDSRADR